MIHLDRPTRFVAITLAGLAGYVDAVGYLASGGYFVSFMSGNSTRMAIGIAQDARPMLTAGALIAGFVGGVVFGSLAGRVLARRRVPVLLAMLGLCLALASVSAGSVPTLATLTLVAFAMGAENVVFGGEGEVRFGLTYMTGTLVKMGQHIADALTGQGGRAWTLYAALWAGLVTGAVLGATLFARAGLAALWVPAATALIFAGGLARRG